MVCKLSGKFSFVISYNFLYIEQLMFFHVYYSWDDPYILIWISNVQTILIKY